MPCICTLLSKMERVPSDAYNLEVHADNDGELQNFYSGMYDTTPRNRYIFRCKSRACNSQRSFQSCNRFFQFENRYGKINSNMSFASIMGIVYYFLHTNYATLDEL